MSDRPEPTPLWPAGCKLPWWLAWASFWLCDVERRPLHHCYECTRCGKMFDD